MFYPDPQHIRYLFVDAGCLRAQISAIATQYLGVSQPLRVDWQALRDHHDKVFYYDAVPSREHNESDEVWHSRIDPQMEQLREIRREDGFHVPLGDLRGKKVRQKKVDVMITVDMLLHTMRHNMHSCTLLAGDSDFQPLLEALIREGMMVTLWHPTKAPDDLIGAADSHKELKKSELLGMIFGPNGYPLLPRQSSSVRPKPLGPADLRWTHSVNGEICEVILRRFQSEWLAERYDPHASATSFQLYSRDAFILVNAIADLWGIDVTQEDLQRATKLDGV